MMSLHHAQLTIPAGSEDEARRYYGGLLDWREIPKPEALQANGGLWFELNGIQIHFGVQDGVDRFGSRSHLAFEVEDLSRVRGRLTPVGGMMPEIKSDVPGFRRFETRDPFGNRLEFLARN